MGKTRRKRENGPFGAPTPYQRRAKLKREQAADRRAKWRYLIAKLAGTSESTLAELRDVVEKLMLLGSIPMHRVPSEECIRQLRNRWREGEQSLENYFEKAGRGRQKALVDPLLEMKVNRVLALGQATIGNDHTGINARELTDRLREEALERGVTPMSYYQVRSMYARSGRVARVAARYGSRAAEVDAVPHGQIIANCSNEIWALDELRFPVYARALHPITNEWVSIEPDLVAVVDVKSGAVVGWHLIDPTLRWGQEDDEVKLTGFDSDDVLAALLSAACPELATGSTQAFSGCLPKILRWDNAKPHYRLAERLEELGIDVSFIGQRRPNRNAAAERKVSILKSICAGIFGHVADYLPTDRVTKATADLSRLRATVGGYTKEAVSRVEPIAPQDLHTVEELRLIFDHALHRYNFTTPLSRSAGCTRYALFLQKLDRRRIPPRGRDLVRALDLREARVSEKGIEYTRNYTTHTFFPAYDGKMLMLDTVVSYYADPKGRGIFVREYEGGKLHFIAPQLTYDKAVGTLKALNIAATPRRYSDYAAMLRKAHVAAEVGEAGYARAQDSFAMRVEDLSNVNDLSDEPDVARESQQTTGAEAVTEPDHIWASDNPADYIIDAQD